MSSAIVIAILLVLPFLVAYGALARLGLVGYWDWAYPAMIRVLRSDRRWTQRSAAEKVVVVASLCHFVVLSFVLVASILGLVRNAVLGLSR